MTMSHGRARLATTARCRSPSPKSRPRRASGMARRYSSRSPTDTLRAPDYCHQVASGSQAARCSGVHCCCDCCAAAGEVANVSARASSAVAVCTENSILIDYVTESPNFNGDDRAALLLPDPVRLAVQVEEPT